jgi:methylglutaconyl-CoA hydratase
VPHGKAFCAGADLNWMREMAGYSWDENHGRRHRQAGRHAVGHCQLPGAGDCPRAGRRATGGGVGLVAACDIAVGHACRMAHFCLSEVKLGLIPATISPYVLRAMGTRAAALRYFPHGRALRCSTQALRSFAACVHEVVEANDDLDCHRGRSWCKPSCASHGPAGRARGQALMV